MSPARTTGARTTGVRTTPAHQARDTVLRPWRGPADSAALAALDDGAPGIGDTTGPEWHDDAAADPARMHLVLERHGEPGPAGYVVLAAPRGPEPGVELHRLVVHPDRRGTGAGRALLGAALAVAGVPGATGETPERPPWAGTGRLWLEVAADNAAALALYRSAGMVTETVLRAVPGDPCSTPLRLLLARG
ncbi:MULTISPECIES: GNAT family N-acetyltransferase [unclassified Pseudonocardia]|uniref:GNAT family N-acetyltransferase n=1 Tax=unclassified Pseudonocardia TaxID=2619320 RepID=UPI0011151014|nr:MULTISPECIES: GNAT family N-acetyltransferase [unclassified Pseudonocardia]